MEAFLGALMPRLLPDGRSFGIHAFQGKTDLLAKLRDRLSGYAKWLPPEWRIVVVLDRDDDDCAELKQRVELAAAQSGIGTKTAGVQPWRLVNRIAIEELEAWYFGDWAAVRQAYPRAPKTIPQKASFRYPDAVAGGTWEAFERVLRRAGYFEAGLPKVETARTMGALVSTTENSSPSFRQFCAAIDEAVA